MSAKFYEQMAVADIGDQRWPEVIRTARRALPPYIHGALNRVEELLTNPAAQLTRGAKDDALITRLTHERDKALARNETLSSTVADLESEVRELVAEKEALQARLDEAPLEAIEGLD